jgi:SnoaL-like protein
MITREFATQFAQEWIASWNSHDITRILSHYHEDFEMSSPYIAQIAGESSGVLKGKEAVGAYWAKALARIPALQFELHSVLTGVDSIVLYYRGVKGMAAEVCHFGLNRTVVKSFAHYADPL